MRYFILSQPKAGTYLCSNLFKEFGLPSSNIHISTGKYVIYSPEDVAKGKKKGETIKSGIGESIKTCNDGHFTVGHLGYDEKTRELLKDWKKVVLFRNESERERSFRTWVEDAGRKWNEGVHSRYITDIPKHVAKWENQEDVFRLDFDDMININVERLDALQEHLFGEVKYDSAQCMQRALDTDSLTKSKKRK